MFGIPCDILNTDVETAAGNSVQATSSIGRPSRSSFRNRSPSCSMSWSLGRRRPCSGKQAMMLGSLECADRTSPDPGFGCPG